MDAIPAADGEEAAQALQYLEEYKRWLKAQGKSDVLVKQTARSLVVLFEEDGKSIASMATPAYFDLVKASHKNVTSHNQRSSALKHLQAFWQNRTPGPPEDAVDNVTATPKNRRSSAAPGSAASASAPTPGSTGERQEGTPAQAAAEVKVRSPGSAGDAQAQEMKESRGDRRAQRARWKARKRAEAAAEVAAALGDEDAARGKKSKRKREKKEGRKSGRKKPPAVPLASAPGVEEALEQAKQLVSEGRLSGALCVLGRDPAAKNCSVNGIYVDRQKPFHGRNSYIKEGGEGRERYLFYSSTKGAWKVSDRLNDSKNGFAFAKVEDRGQALPSDMSRVLEWRVFGGKAEGYKKDRAVRCLAAASLVRALAPEFAVGLGPDDNAAANGDESEGEQGSGDSSSCQQGSEHSSDDEKGTVSSSSSESGGDKQAADEAADAAADEAADAHGFKAACPVSGKQFVFPEKPVRREAGWGHTWCKPCRRQHRQSALVCIQCNLKLVECRCS